MLIEITDSLIVSDSEIERVCRNGAYTVVTFKSDWRCSIEIWDEHRIVWNRIRKATEN